MAEFLSMGGYGAYIWPSFGVTAVLLVVLLISSLRFAKRSEQALKELEEEMPDNPRRRPQ